MDAFQHRFNETEMAEGHTPIALSNLTFAVNRTLYYVSIGLCSSITIVYLLMRYQDRKYDRLSLRLLIHAMYAHIFMGIAGILRTISLSHPACQFVMVLYVFTDLYSMFCVMCISINVQIIFLHGKRHWKHLERYYLIGSFTLSLIISIIPAFVQHGGYGPSRYMGCCWYNSSSSFIISLWSLLTIYLWVCISIVYSVIALIFVLIKTGAEEQKINRQLVHPHQSQSKRFRFIWLCFRPYESMPRTSVFSPRRTSYFLKIVSRVIWYPIVLIVSRVWGLINFAYISNPGKIKAFYVLMANVAVPLQGFLLFFIFLCDPAFQQAVRDLYTNIYEQSRQDRSPTMYVSDDYAPKKRARSFPSMSEIMDRTSMSSVATSGGDDELTLSPYMSQHLRADLSYPTYPNPAASDPQLYAQQPKHDGFFQKVKSTTSLDTTRLSSTSRDNLYPFQLDDSDDVSQLRTHVPQEPANCCGDKLHHPLGPPRYRNVRHK